MWTKKDAKEIAKLVEEAQEKLNMQSWIVDLYFSDDPPRENGNGKTTAYSSILFEYEKIKITFFPELVKEQKDNDGTFEDTVYHELIHGLTHELYELATKRFVTQDDCTNAVERLTQRITRLI